MTTRANLLLSIFVTLLLVLSACGPGGGEDTTVIPGADAVTPPADTTSPPADTGSPPGDAGVTPDTPVTPSCDDPGIVALTLDGATECVTEGFAEAMNHLDGITLVRTQPDDGEEITLEFHHVSETTYMITECDGFSKFFIDGLGGLVPIACIDENLDLSMCEINTEPCLGGTLTGSITYSKSFTSTVTLNTDYCGENWCDNFVYESPTE